MVLQQVSFVERSSLSQRVPYRRFHCTHMHRQCYIVEMLLVGFVSVEGFGIRGLVSHNTRQFLVHGVNRRIPTETSMHSYQHGDSGVPIYVCQMGMQRVRWGCGERDVEVGSAYYTANQLIRNGAQFMCEQQVNDITKCRVHVTQESLAAPTVIRLLSC